MAGNAEGLTEDQEDFLKMCEEKFKNRFTEDDEDFMIVHKKSIGDPPILSPWYAARPRRNNRDDNRYRRSDGNSGDRSGNSGRNSYHERSGNSFVDRDHHRHSDNRYRPYNSRQDDRRRW